MVINIQDTAVFHHLCFLTFTGHNCSQGKGRQRGEKGKLEMHRETQPDSSKQGMPPRTYIADPCLRRRISFAGLSDGMNDHRYFGAGCGLRTTSGYVGLFQDLYQTAGSCYPPYIRGLSYNHLNPRIVQHNSAIGAGLSLGFRPISGGPSVCSMHGQSVGRHARSKRCTIAMSHKDWHRVVGEAPSCDTLWASEHDATELLHFRNRALTVHQGVYTSRL